jgi:hypothetical protein
MVARFVVARVRAEHGRRWLEGLRQRPLACRAVVPELRLCAEQRLRGVPDAAASALCGWADGARPARLLREIPTAREVLAMSARGARCVSLLEEPRGLGFALHDLCHLEKFADPRYHEGQVGFFARLERALAESSFGEVEDGLDAEWSFERDRVMADMNASPIFLHCGLRSRLQKACVRAGLEHEFARRWERILDLMGLRGPIRGAARAVTSRHASRADSLALDGYFAAVGAAARVSEARGRG